MTFEKYSIYEVVLDIVNEALKQPDNSVIFKHTALTELKKALEKARKQEKLLNKIKEIIDRPHTYIASMLESSNRFYEIKELIKEREND